MDKNRINKLLRKVTTLLEDDDLNLLERDLTKKYLVELYEYVDQMADHQVTIDGAPKIDEIVVAEHPAQQPTLATKETTEVPADEVQKNEPVVEIDHDGTASQVYKQAEENKPTIPKSTPPPMPIDAPPTEAAVTNAVQFQRDFSNVVTREERIPSKYRILFEREKQHELSDKLSLSPISDLRRALGINDKLLVVNELFDGQQDQFQETVDRLNAKYSFSEARSYLVRYVIDKFDWLDEEKLSPARDFIKLVERRFLNS